MCNSLGCLGVYKSFIISYNLKEKHISTFLGAMELKFLLYTMGITTMNKVCPDFNWLIWLDLGILGLNEVCENVMCSHELVEKAVYSFIAHSILKISRDCYSCAFSIPCTSFYIRNAGLPVKHLLNCCLKWTIILRN